MKFIFLLLLMSGELILAASTNTVTCNSGSPDQLELVNQLNEAKRKHGSVAQILYKKYKLDEEKKSSDVCANCIPTPGFETIKSLESTIENLRAKMKVRSNAQSLAFKAECLEAANLKLSPSRQVSCQKDKKGQFKVTSAVGKTNPCITKSVLAYQNAVLTNFYNCTYKEGFEGPDLNLMFRKFSQESGFRPNYDYRGGLGPSMLVSNFIEDIYLPGRGLEILKSVADSNLPECEAAKIIAKKDLKVMPKPDRTDPCAFIHPGEGLERSYLYSMIGVETVWRKSLRPLMANFLKEHAKHPQLREALRYIQMTAYGPGGTKEAIQEIRLLKRLKIDKFLSKVKKPITKMKGKPINSYSQQINSAQAGLIDRLSPKAQEEYNKHGADSCLNTY